MNGFDELLEHVLTADGSASPPPGMDGRIRRALCDADSQPATAWRFWRGAIAAVLLLGIAGAVMRNRGVRLAPAGTSGPDLIRSAAPTRDPAASALPVMRMSLVGRSPVQRARKRRVLRNAVPDVGSLTVAPLTVESIKVAALNFDRVFDARTQERNEGARR